jgi:hypothetical protein
MKTLTNRVKNLVSSAVLVAGTLAMIAPAAHAQTDEKSAAALASAQASFEQMLNDLGVLYQKVTPQDGGEVQFKIAIQGEGNTSTIVARLRVSGWNYTDQTPVIYVSMYSQLLQGGEGHIWSSAVHQKVSEKTDYCMTGSFTVSQWGVYAINGFFFRGLDAETLNFYLFDLHYNGVELKSQLNTIMQAELAEK